VAGGEPSPGADVRLHSRRSARCTKMQKKRPPPARTFQPPCGRSVLSAVRECRAVMHRHSARSSRALRSWQTTSAAGSRARLHPRLPRLHIAVGANETLRGLRQLACCTMHPRCCMLHAASRISHGVSYSGMSRTNGVLTGYSRMSFVRRTRVRRERASCREVKGSRAT
jgi:hypothetical protein